MCFLCSKEPSHSDGSFEYPQQMFWMRNEKKQSHFIIYFLYKVWKSGPITVRANISGHYLDFSPNGRLREHTFKENR